MDPWLFRRISVRVLENGQARDVIGRVWHRTTHEVRLMHRDGRIESVMVADIIAAREVPDDPRRLRPASSVEPTVLHAIVAAHDPLASVDHSTWVRDLTPSESRGLPEASDLPSAAWWALVPAPWRARGEDWTRPEVRAFGTVANQVAWRVVLAGDWCGLSLATAATGPDPAAAVTTAATDAFDWATARGARHAWILVPTGDVASGAVADWIGAHRLD